MKRPGKHWVPYEVDIATGMVVGPIDTRGVVMETDEEVRQWLFETVPHHRPDLRGKRIDCVQEDLPLIAGR